MSPALSAPQVRRIALAAQGFGGSQPSGTVNRGHLTRLVDRLRLIQMDSVSVAVRAHYMPIFSRLGDYDRSVLESAAWDTRPSRRRLVEYWAHEAALIPVDDWPLFRWRMREYADGRWHRDRMQQLARLRRSVHSVITERGLSSSGDVEDALGHTNSRAPGSWWERSDVKIVCESMFAAGELSALRRNGFARHYDLSERIVGDRIADVPTEKDAVRELVLASVRAVGVGSEPDIRDYYRLSPRQTREALADLCSTGEVTQVDVQGQSVAHYMLPKTRVPQKISQSALLSPFDPVVFFRPRLQRIFGMEYRIEIYTPAPKRRYGYYVFPYLCGDQISARVDLKADRNGNRLQALGTFGEADIDVDGVAASLATDLRRMAHWLGLDDVDVRLHGDLAAPLQAHLR